MKILSIGNFGYGWDGSICDEEHIAGALEELGHEVARMQRDQVTLFNEKYDFVLISQYDGYPPNLMTSLKTNTLGAPIVYWAFDYQADGQEWHEMLVNQCDLYLSKRIADSKYENWQWLAQDFAPKFLDETQDPPKVKDIDILFTGSYLSWATERNELLKAVDERFSLTICSVNGADFVTRGFKDVRGPVMDEALPALIARAKINLSIDHTLEAGYWSDRNAQIMACGGLVLSRYVPLSEVRFISGTCIPFYDKEHCLEEIENILEMHEEDLDSVRRVGYQWAHRNLRVIDRVNDLLSIVEGIL